MSTVKWIYSQMVSEKRLLMLTITFAILSNIAGVMTPFFTGYAIDSVEREFTSNSARLDEIFFLSFLILLFAGLAYLFNIISWYSGECYSAKLTQQLRSDIFTTLQEQSHRYFDDNSTGDLLSRATTDILALWDLFWVIPYLGLAGVTTLFATLGFLLFYIDFQLGIIACLFLPTIIVFSKRFGSGYNPLMLESRKRFGQLSKVIQENLEGAAVSRAFGAKEKELNRFDRENKAYLEVMFKVRKKQATFTPQMKMLSGSMSAVILVIGAFRAIDGTLPVGMLIAAVLYASMLARPINQITDLFIDWGRGHGASQRIMEILESTPEIVEESSAIDLPCEITGTICFEQASFGYREEPVLHGISLTIKGGLSVVFLGGTGSGKSSLINLIPRFYDVTKGQVTVDGTDVRQLTLHSLRKHIGFVDQETYLFSRSVHENIAFGQPGAAREDVIRVAKMARAHDFIMELTDGYETLIGERGVNLSGGQRQRISIARALLADPKIVILDDSLSAVDTKTEREINAATKKLLESRTTIIVTQRLSNIVSADKIVILKDGQIVEEGTHEELSMNRRGWYRQLLDTEKDGLLDLTVITDKTEVKQDV
ncbi:MAG: ABC transporter ATP-binding protein [Candidatus Hodarchaeales archaeon]